MLKKVNIFVFIILGLFNSLQVNAETFHVEINKFKFSPQQLTITVGDTVIWTNREKRQYHSVWFKDAGDEEPDYFFPDETYQRTFNQVGAFNYVCGPHPKMIGSVLVEKKQR